ncbi:MAG TPA: SCP-2 sterol transfer family protein [Ruminococcaceae bacterium]|nr:SCP-2 sterol transfer family protein [Oscillospiraceae bacterium]
MTYQEIVAAVKDFCRDADLGDYKKHLAVEVAITGEGEGVFYIEAKDGRINVEPYNYNDRDVRLIAKADNFIAIAKGELDPVKAFLSGKLRIDGSMEKALEFQKVISRIGADKNHG